ncbi:radical SAM protein [Patescibacteria group bacterium]|nr:radical SAM protein [Patescibacteria group bacterium]
MSYKSDTTRANRTSEAIEFPAVFLIDNCNCCNLKCSVCDHKNMTNYRPFQIMDFELYKKIINEIAIENPNAKVWEIFFGEPFLCLDMADRIRYAKRKGLTDVVLNTNGVLMNKEKARAVIEAGLDAIYVGIDSINEKSYNQIRIGGDYNRVCKNVLDYKDLLDKIGKPNQKIFVQFVVSDINEKEIDDFKNFWEKHGIGIKIRPKISWAGLVDAPNLWENKDVSRKPCYWLMRTINICADGEVSLCSVDLHCQVKCGNIKNNSIKELWDGKLKEYRNMHKNGRYNELPKLCRDCRDWQSAYAEFYGSY